MKQCNFCKKELKDTNRRYCNNKCMRDRANRDYYVRKGKGLKVEKEEVKL